MGMGAGSARLTARTWQHLAVTWDGNMVGHYVDGVERDSHAQRGTIDGISTGLGLGCRDIRSNGGHANAYEFLIGTIDEVAIYSRALSSTELRHTSRPRADSRRLASPRSTDPPGSMAHSRRSTTRGSRRYTPCLTLVRLDA